MTRIFEIAMLAVAAMVLPADANGPMRSEINDDAVTIYEHGMPVLRYQRAVKSLDGKWPRANYVHPLFDLDGQAITEDFPQDHRHHRGVFWAWHQVWVGDKKLGDSWICNRFVWDVRSVETQLDDGTASIVANVFWKSPDHRTDQGDMIPVVHEQTTITVCEATAKYRIIDFRIQLLALVDDVKIGGSEDDKGYGGFSPRIALRQGQRFVSVDGELEPIKTAIEAGSWINISDDKGGIVILSNQANPLPNRKWILRSQRSMQNALYPGRDPVRLSKVEPVRLHYRLVIHRGDLTAAEINQLQP